jgi:hypothetical protein
VEYLSRWLPPPILATFERDLRDVTPGHAKSVTKSQLNVKSLFFSPEKREKRDSGHKIWGILKIFAYPA